MKILKDYFSFKNIIVYNHIIKYINHKRLEVLDFGRVE